MYDLGHEAFNRTTIRVYSDDKLSSSEVGSPPSDFEDSEVVECVAQGNNIVALK